MTCRYMWRVIVSKFRFVNSMRFNVRQCWLYPWRHLCWYVSHHESLHRYVGLASCEMPFPHNGQLTHDQFRVFPSLTEWPLITSVKIPVLNHESHQRETNGSLLCFSIGYSLIATAWLCRFAIAWTCLCSQQSLIVNWHLSNTRSMHLARFSPGKLIAASKVLMSTVLTLRKGLS